jgi:RNA polymerase sigma-70 factor (ECF subfamily)
MSRRHFDPHDASIEAVDDAGHWAEAARGTDSSFELLVRTHTPAVWKLARSLLRDDHEAEDAVQDTFVKAYRGLRGYRAEASPLTWLLSICYRTCMDRLRKKRAEIVSLEEARLARSAERDRETKLALEAAVETLAEEERRAFLLVDVLGYSREEAASVIGVPASTMRSRLARARARLAEEMTDSPTFARASR